eukprot:scaffold970_cov187-Amphora_coffeaeformis.AAC.5
MNHDWKHAKNSTKIPYTMLWYHGLINSTTEQKTTVDVHHKRLRPNAMRPRQLQHPHPHTYQKTHRKIYQERAGPIVLGMDGIVQQLFQWVPYNFRTTV